MSRLAREVTTLLLIGLVLAAGATPALADTNLNVGGLAIIANTGGDPIMVRSGPGYQYEVVGHAGEGDIVTVVDGPVAGDDGNLWYKVSTDVLTGYVFADFLVLPENAPAHPQKAQEPQVQAQTLANPSGGGGYAASIAGTGGDGVRLRDSAGLDGAIILVIPEGATVQVLGDPQQAGGSAWYPVSYDGSTGYVVGDYIGSQGSMQAATTVSTAAQAQGFAAGTHVQVSGTGTDDLRIRDGAGTGADIVGHAPAGAVLKVTGGPANDDAGNAWYQVDYDGLDGYVAADFLAWTDAALSSREVVAATAPADPAPAPQTSEAAPAAAPKAAAAESAPAPAPKPAAAPAPPPPPPPSNGDAIVAVAMKYVGYPYVWGGTSPGGFDCSGFTYYVIKQVLGENIGTSTGVQIGVGTPVSAKDLQPGDLVFFQNTYEAGLSHVGIYIGGGQMVHAGSERTGVTISNIWDSYWGPRYYAARRIT